MRAAVGHLTRNIKIKGEDKDGWGGKVFSYFWRWVDENDPSVTASLRGRVVMDGVEFENMGQKNTQFGGLDIRYNEHVDLDEDEIKERTSIVTRSSFHRCAGFCVGLEHVNGFVLKDSVLAEAERHLLSIFYI